MTHTAIVRSGWRRTDGLALLLTFELALLAGGLLGKAEGRAPLIAAALGFVALAVVTFEAPIVTFGLIGLMLAFAPADAVDSLAPAVTTRLYGSLLPYVIVGLLLAALAVSKHARREHDWWPGSSATIALVLVGIGVVASFRFGSPKENLFVTRPIMLLAMSIFVGYWMAQRYGARLLLTLLVAAAGLSIPLGLYNIATGHELSYYDASAILLLGISSTLVLFSAVNIGIAKVPFLLLSTLVIVLSFRRAAIIAILLTIAITVLVKGGRGSRGLIFLATIAVVVLEIASPGFVLDRVGHVVGYFAGSSGADYSVNYRKYETANVWLNVKRHWLDGIGPTADWTVFTTFSGRFQVLGTDYAHNSYLWVWLRYGLAGVLTYAAFFVVTPAALIRRSAPVESVIIGAAIVGLAFAVGTASFLTTTVRWPLIVGLFVGIALHARNASRDAAAA